MEKGFFERLSEICQRKNTLLCVGLDPRVALKSGENVRTKIVESNRRLIEACASYAAAFKPNIAFYEAWGPEGLAALEETVELIPEECLIILDAKRGDIGATAEAYADGAFRMKGVDAVTLSPYMGKDAVMPFLKPGKGVFLLARTSNPSAAEIQELDVGGSPLYLHVAEKAAGWGPEIGLVAGATDPKALRKIRKRLPEVWFLCPGIGAQGGSIEDAVSSGLRSDGLGLLAVAAREISGAADPAAKAKEIRDQLNVARGRVLEGHGPGLKMSKLKRRVLEGLIKTECFKLGEFTLKSGLKSPFYVDLRRVSSDARLLKAVGKAYGRLMRGLSFDRLAGIPLAALPLATAAALETGASLIYPRIPPKAHGSGNVIEGEYKAGERVLLLDDLITTGKSKVEAVEVLRSEGLVVEDLAVILERGAQGRRDMESLGIRLHAFAQIEEFFQVALELGLIDEQKRQSLIQFAKEN